VRTPIIPVQRALSSFRHPDNTKYVGGSRLREAKGAAAMSEIFTGVVCRPGGSAAPVLTHAIQGIWNRTAVNVSDS
jgi:hypothetical protein